MENEPQAKETRNSGREKKLTLVIGVIALGVMMTLAGRNRQQCGCSLFGPGCGSQVTSPGGLNETARPRLLDLGSGKCMPCKKMAPILDELKKEYAARVDVEFIDVRENPDAARRHGVESIPTQIFFDVTGKERYRHQGFFAKEDILEKWEELGLTSQISRKGEK